MGPLLSFRISALTSFIGVDLAALCWFLRSAGGAFFFTGRNALYIFKAIVILCYEMMCMSQPQPELKLYEKLLAIFPGYRGYKEKELIRETDKIVREHLYRRLKLVLETLRNTHIELVSKNKLAEAGEVERIIYYLDSLTSKTRHAPHGYKPLFHVVKMDERDLRTLLEHDLSLSELVDKLSELVESLRMRASAAEDVKSVLRDVYDLARKYEFKLVERDNILIGMGGTK